MSCDFYFKSWLNNLDKLDKLVQLDLLYQNTKVKDKKLCDASQRLTGMFGSYCSIYKVLIQCQKQNLQLQKIKYIDDIINAIVLRMMELKHQIGKLESSERLFFGQGLITQMLTPYDVELSDLPSKLERSEQAEKAIEEAFENVQIQKEEEERIAREEQEKALEDLLSDKVENWWGNEGDPKDGAHNQGLNFAEMYKVEEKLDEETLKKRHFIALIQAHEKTRQVTKWQNIKRQKREMWAKELAGELHPAARPEVKEKAAAIIQKVFRAYFGAKRRKIQDCNRDELLGIRHCRLRKIECEFKFDEIRDKKTRNELLKEYKNEWEQSLKELKENYLERKGPEIAEDFRDGIRDWFKIWYDKVKYLYDIPKDKNGGSVKIVTEEIPTPDEWLELYKEYMDKKNKNKNKSAQESNWEKQRAKKGNKMADKEDKLKKRMEEAMQRKLMKNPTMHPGYKYPESKKTESILLALNKYREDWKDLDDTESLDVKVKFVKAIDVANMCYEAKMEVRTKVDEDMRKELKQLKKSLKAYYKRIEEQMPETMKTKGGKRVKRAKKDYVAISDDVKNRMKDLALKGILIESVPTKLQDYKGDFNFAGDDFRCINRFPQSYGGETRMDLWDKCREMQNKGQRILLVGPRGSGKKTVVNMMASSNEAALFVIDPVLIEDDQLTEENMEELVKSVALCAKAVQPSVVFIKHVQRLFYSKVPPEDKGMKLDILKQYIGKKLFKKISKKDKITIIGSCFDPWLTRSKLLLKKFPEVVLMPPTNTSAVVQLLNDWVLRQHTLPRDLEVSSLARILQGYRYDVIRDGLDGFMNADQLVKIAARGYNDREVLDYFLHQYGSEAMADNEKYLKWYQEKTQPGKKEMKKIKDQIAFEDLSQKYAEKMMKKKRRPSRGRRRSSGSRRSNRSRSLSKSSVNLSLIKE